MGDEEVIASLQSSMEAVERVQAEAERLNEKAREAHIWGQVYGACVAAGRDPVWYAKEAVRHYREWREQEGAK